MACAYRLDLPRVKITFTIQLWSRWFSETWKKTIHLSRAEEVQKRLSSGRAKYTQSSNEIEC